MQIRIHYLAAGLTVSVHLPSWAPLTSAAIQQQKALEAYLEPKVAPLIAARFPFAEIATCVRGALLKIAHKEAPFSFLVTEQEVHKISIVKGQMTAFPKDME